MDIKKLFESFVPFILIGIAIAVCIGLLGMFFSIALWGLLIGGILWIIALIQKYFFPSKPSNKADGRIIEHDDNK